MEKDLAPAIEEDKRAVAESIETARHVLNVILPKIVESLTPAVEELDQSLSVEDFWGPNRGKHVDPVPSSPSLGGRFHDAVSSARQCGSDRVARHTLQTLREYVAFEEAVQQIIHALQLQSEGIDADSTGIAPAARTYCIDALTDMIHEAESTVNNLVSHQQRLLALYYPKPLHSGASETFSVLEYAYRTEIVADLRSVYRLLRRLCFEALHMTRVHQCYLFTQTRNEP